MEYAAPFTSPIYSIIVQELAKLAETVIDNQSGIKEDILQLQSKTSKIEEVLINAETNASSDGKTWSWLTELRDVAYDIEDIIEYCKLEAPFLVNTPTISNSSAADDQQCLCSCLPFCPCCRLASTKVWHWASCSCCTSMRIRHKIRKQIQKVITKLDRYDKDASQLGLQKSPAVLSQPHYGITSETIQDPPLDVVGSSFQTKKAELLEVLVSTGDRHVSILAILGMRGIGKTTLAQMIFNDPVAEKKFQKRIWVYVSNHFDEKEILKTVIKGASKQCDQNDDKASLVTALTQAVCDVKFLLKTVITDVSGQCSQLNDKASLVTALTDAVRDVNFLLVLDDVHDGRIWEDLLKVPLMKGASGSWVLVTSRYDNVANFMRVQKRCLMELMEEQEAWDLLCKTVFEESDESMKARVKDFGIQIVKNCGCLPLAIKAIGGALRCRDYHKVDEWKALADRVWSFISSSSENSHVMKALYLCYHELNPKLRQCFLSCSLFPENYEFHKNQLIDYWIAEGFIEQMEPLQMRTEGGHYYDELVARHILQEIPNSTPKNAHRIHDLLRELATLLGEKENYLGERLAGFTPSEISLRRLSLINKSSLDDFDPKLHCKRLRTLMLHNSSEIRSIPKYIFKRMKYLRVLSLRGTSIEALPDSIKYLGLLKHLDLSLTPIKSLPDSIGSLINLMFLLLVRCKKLCSLPDAIVKLTNLRVINLDEAHVHKMPRGVRALLQLTKMHWTVEETEAEGETGRGIEELGHLKNLVTLEINDVDKLQSAEIARLAALYNKEHLHSLSISCSATPAPHRDITDFPKRCTRSQREVTEGNTASKRIEEIFEALQPPECLQELSILDYFGNFPPWLSAGVLSQLSDLDLTCCSYVRRAPPLGQLPQLKRLTIKCSMTIETLNSEFFIGEKEQREEAPFPKLEILYIRNLYILNECNWDERSTAQIHSFPCLRKLRFGFCPKVVSLWGCLQYATSLSDLSIGHLDSLRSLPDLPALRSLHVTECPSIEQIGNFRVLDHVCLRDKNAQALPSWLGMLRTRSGSSSAPSLRNMQIIAGNCDILRRLCPWNSDNQCHMIESVPDVYACIENQSFFVQYEKVESSTHAHLQNSCFKFDHLKDSLVEIALNTKTAPAEGTSASSVHADAISVATDMGQTTTVTNGKAAAQESVNDTGGTSTAPSSSRTVGDSSLMSV